MSCACTEFVDVAGGLREKFGKLSDEGLSEQWGEGGGGNEITVCTDFMAASGVVTVFGCVECKLHES